VPRIASRSDAVADWLRVRYASDRCGKILIAQGAKCHVYVIGHQRPGAFSPDLTKTRLKSRVYRFDKNAAEKPRVPIWQDAAEKAACTDLTKTRLKSRVYRFGKTRLKTRVYRVQLGERRE